MNSFEELNVEVANLSIWQLMKYWIGNFHNPRRQRVNTQLCVKMVEHAGVLGVIATFSTDILPGTEIGSRENFSIRLTVIDD